jgi:upstream activation factor subunit UAF30
MSTSSAHEPSGQGPSNEAVLPVLEWIVQSADIKQASLRSIIHDLSFKFNGYDFSERKNWIKEQVIRCLRERTQGQVEDTAAVAPNRQHVSEAASSSSTAFRAPSTKGKSKTTGSRKHNTKQRHEKQGNDHDPELFQEVPLRFTGLMAPVLLSSALAAVCGGTDILPRPWIAKHLHAYVREHGLRDPEQRMHFRPDAALAKLFPDRELVSFFEMNKLLEQHIRKERQCTDEERARLQAWRQEWEAKGLTQKRRIPQKRQRTAATGRFIGSAATNGALSPVSGSQSTQTSHGSASVATTGKKASGLAQPLRLSDALKDVCGGARYLSRCQVVQSIWSYIKQHQLQDPDDRKAILCDSKLQRVFDGETRVTAFGMNRYLSRHLQPLSSDDQDEPDTTDAESLSEN